MEKIVFLNITQTAFTYTCKCHNSRAGSVWCPSVQIHTANELHLKIHNRSFFWKRTHARTHAYTHTHTHILKVQNSFSYFILYCDPQECFRERERKRNANTWKRAQVHTCGHMHRYTHVDTCTGTHTCMDTRTHAHVDTCTRTHTQRHINKRTGTHTHARPRGNMHV